MSNSIPQSTSTLVSWLSYLGKLHTKDIDMSLDRVSKVAACLGVLEMTPFIFTVAGTNGKGTTCRILETILIAAGYKVGVYSSPHFMYHTERVRVQNAILPECMHTDSFSEIEGLRNNIPLTYFEYSTLSALKLFKQAQLDIVILEVGLGGRLDATNIVDSDVAIITNVALDHTNWLGSNREDIGYEKAGIFRSKKPAIFGELDVPNTIWQVAKEKGTKLLCYGIDWKFTTSKKSWIYSDEDGTLENLPLPYIPQSNAAIALAALRASHIEIDKLAIHKGIRNATLPGRFQIVKKSPCIILDVAHNPHAAAYLSERIKLIPKTGRVLGVIGMLYDKDIASTVANIKNAANSWYCASLNEPRGASSAQLAKYINESKNYENVTDAWYAAVNDANPEDTILVCGSFHTVACVMREMNISSYL